MRLSRMLYWRRGFTLIELLIVVAIISILAAIAVVNFQEANERALLASNASNLKVIAIGLQTYYVDYNRLPPADREAGPFQSHTRDFTQPGNGPAGGGSWDGVPWLLVDRGYISDSNILFNPRYRKKYSGGETIRGGYPRYHNFRYAYNSSSASSGGHLGGNGNVETGTVWILRDLFLPADSGFYGSDYPNYPADFEFPWKDGQAEQVLYSDFSVKLFRGGSNEEWRD